MPTFPLVLQPTYWKQGFFNVTVDYDGYIRRDDGTVEIVLVSGSTEQVVNGEVKRTAQRNGTARVYGKSRLRDWLQAHYKVGDQVNVEIRTPARLRIVAPKR